MNMKALLIKEIATAHMRLAMTGSELCKGLEDDKGGRGLVRFTLSEGRITRHCRGPWYLSTLAEVGPG